VRRTAVETTNGVVHNMPKGKAQFVSAGRAGLHILPGQLLYFAEDLQVSFGRRKDVWFEGERKSDRKGV
jgi:hypothetical protein